MTYLVPLLPSLEVTCWIGSQGSKVATIVTLRLQEAQWLAQGQTADGRTGPRKWCWAIFCRNVLSSVEFFSYGWGKPANVKGSKLTTCLLHPVQSGLPSLHPTFSPLSLAYHFDSFCTSTVAWPGGTSFVGRLYFALFSKGQEIDIRDSWGGERARSLTHFKSRSPSTSFPPLLGGRAALLMFKAWWLWLKRPVVNYLVLEGPHLWHLKGKDFSLIILSTPIHIY